MQGLYGCITITDLIFDLSCVLCEIYYFLSDTIWFCPGWCTYYAGPNTCEIQKILFWSRRDPNLILFIKRYYVHIKWERPIRYTRKYSSKLKSWWTKIPGNWNPLLPRVYRLSFGKNIDDVISRRVMTSPTRLRHQKMNILKQKLIYERIFPKNLLWNIMHLFLTFRTYCKAMISLIRNPQWK